MTPESSEVDETELTEAEEVEPQACHVEAQSLNSTHYSEASASTEFEDCQTDFQLQDLERPDTVTDKDALSVSVGQGVGAHDRPTERNQELAGLGVQDHGVEGDFIPRMISRSHSTGVNVLSHTGDIVLRSLRPMSSPVRTGLLPDVSPARSHQSVDTIKSGNVGVASPDGYHSPTRYDTEARVGMRVMSAEMLWNRVQDDPSSLLARLIVDDLYNVPEVHHIILAYACLIIVLQAVFACATHLLLGTVVFLVVGACLGLMITRHLADILGRQRRIDSLGKEIYSDSANVSARPTTPRKRSRKVKD